MKSTERQKAAVHFCEQWLNIEFEGNIENFRECSNFLNNYLQFAKQTARELTCEYCSYI